MITRRQSAWGISALLLALLVLAFPSCGRFGESSIKLPTTPILTGGLGWAVVKEAYVRLKESPSDAAKDLDHLRRGGVYPLEARNIGPDASSVADKDGPLKPSIWYGLSSEGSKGWVRESELDIYATQSQAEKAAAAYR